MNDSAIRDIPQLQEKILTKSNEIGFSMPSDLFVGSLLKTLITSKPKSQFLELGTGIGLALSWMIAGMDIESEIISIDNDPKLIKIAQTFFENHERLTLICTDASDWLKNYGGAKFDLIFADAWPGKYSEIEEALSLIKKGGFYIIDDMITQPNWPEGHQQNVIALIDYLENRTDFSITKMNWSTGILIATKI